MSVSERSFADRLQRARQLNAATDGFAPPFAPADPSLAPAAFGSFLDGLDTSNLAVATALAAWQEGATARSALVTRLKADTLRALARVKSNPAWKAHVPAVKAAADKLRGYKTAKPAPPAEPQPDQPAATPAKPAREQGDRSYADIKQQGEVLLAALRRIAGFDTGAPVDLTTGALGALVGQLGSANQSVAGKEQALAGNRAIRRSGFDGEGGLSARMKAIKDGVRSQYGQGSQQFLQIKSIRL